MALITDYGTLDSYVAEVKAVILRYRRDLQIVDISNDIASHNIFQAAFVLKCACRTFPEDTVFLCVIDPGVGSERKGLVITTSSGKSFVGPDNGLMYPAAESEGIREVYSINTRLLGCNISQTFHGRDVFAHVVGMMISGQNLSDILESFRDFIRLELPRPEIGEDKIVCKILHVDKFGNTITNVHQSQIPADVKFFDVFHGGRYLGRIPLAGYYSSVNRGNPLLLVGGTGYLELSVSNGSAAYQFKIGVGDKLVLNYQG